MASHWEEDKEFSVADWKREVDEDETRQGYADWVKSQREAVRLSIGVAEAGVDPNHQTDHCDRCGYIFQEPDEAHRTCSNTEYLTLCDKCYTAAGSSVR